MSMYELTHWSSGTHSKIEYVAQPQFALSCPSKVMVVIVVSNIV